MKHKRNGSDSLYIVGYIIALGTVSTGYGTYQLTVFVSQRNGSTVEFHLATDLKILVQGLLHAFIKLCHLGFRISIGQGKHRVFMYDLHKILVQVTPHTHGRRVLVCTFRMLGFQVLQLTHQIVEGLVVNLRCIQHIIIMVMAVKFFTQLVYSFYFIHIYKRYSKDKNRQF